MNFVSMLSLFMTVVGLKVIQQLCICILLNPFKFMGYGIADYLM